MISLNLKLLPDSEDKAVSSSNEATEKTYGHLKNLFNGLKCKKHPSARTVIDVVAVQGQDPKIDVKTVCCQDFLKTISYR